MTRIIDDITLDQVATGGQTGTIAEPSLAVSGKRMLVTGNWFASRSSDRGVSWSFVDPYTELPPAGAGVCCDQLVHYSKPRRLWIWLLQYRKSANGNLIRVAVSATGAPGTWTWWDTEPTDVDTSWAGLWFDYPDMMETDDRLLLSFNLFDVTTDQWRRAAVLRFSLDDLTARGALPREAWSTDQFGSLRFARGPGNSAFFASHSGAAAVLSVFEWPDRDIVVGESIVAVTGWSGGPYVTNEPGGTTWLARLDDRITGGWRANGHVGFAWTAAADTAHPHPFVRVVRIDEQAMTTIDEPDLWGNACAWAYPATVANQRGDIGITAFCGGPSNHPAHTIGWLNERSMSWDMLTVATSTHPPRNGVWGDYIDIQPDPSRRTYWISSGFILDGGSARTNVMPRVVTFKG